MGAIHAKINMKKIVASVGLVALGASALEAAPPELAADSAKPWSVSATLRGFYDDNVNTAPSSSAAKRDTFGFEVSPAVLFSWSLEQTVINFGYVYSYKYYDKPPIDDTDHSSSTHIINALLDHSFSERYQIRVHDSFVIGQEPDTLRSGNAFTTFQRVSGENIRNSGSINFDAQLTPLFGLELGYANNFFDYDDEGGNALTPSLSGRLDRLEHIIHLDSRWTILPQTIGVFGYQYRQVNYTADEVIGFVSTGPLKSEHRDNREHYLYLGVDHVFSPELTTSVRVGGRYVDYYKDPTGDNTGFGPYANANVKWQYLPDCFLEGGITHDLNATDLPGDNGRSFTTDQESTVIYASVKHRFTPKLHASLVAQYQNSEFNGGAFNNETEDYFLVGLNAAYDFTRHFSAEVGYNYDNVNSDVGGRSFDRNRVYIGVTATY
jgi:hypothetical protein